MKLNQGIRYRGWQIAQMIYEGKLTENDKVTKYDTTGIPTYFIIKNRCLRRISGNQEVGNSFLTDNNYGIYYIIEKQPEEVIKQPEDNDECYKPIKILIKVDNDLSKPLERKLTSVSICISEIDEDLFGIENIHDFLGIETESGIIISTEYPYANYNSSQRILRLGRRKMTESISVFKTSSNSRAINVAYEIMRTIEEINKALVKKKKDNCKVYFVQHTPNGKLYGFKSIQELSEGNLVICDTEKGTVYGLVKEVKTELARYNASRKPCFAPPEVTLYKAEIKDNMDEKNK